LRLDSCILTKNLKIEGNNLSVHRRTITIDEELIRKIRNIQAKKIVDSHHAVSFSQVINEILKEKLLIYTRK